MYNIKFKALSKRGYFTLLALLIAITSFAQEITINGVVIDETDTYNPQIEMFARFKMKSSFHKTKRII